MGKGKIISRIGYAILILLVTSMVLPRFVGGKIRTISLQTAELETLLSQMPWVSPRLSNTRVLYKISFRTCPACYAYHKAEFPKLQALDVDTRLFTFARARTPEQNPQEWAVLAQIYAARDWELSESWWQYKNPKRFYSAMQGITPIKDNTQGQARVEQGREHLFQLQGILARNSIKMASPTLIWQDVQGDWKIAIGNSPAANARIRKDLSQIQ